MQIIDRYLVQQFVWVFIIFSVSFLGLFVVADSVNNFEELSTYAKDHGGILKVVSSYYGYRSLAFVDQISALLVLIAAMFTIAAFRRHEEMTALLAAGISKARIVRSIIVVAAIFTVAATINRELLIPSVREELSFNAQDLTKGHLREIRPRYDNETEILLGGAGAVLLERKIDRPSFYLPASLARYGRQVIAQDAVYYPATEDRPSGYLLSGVKQPAKLADKPSLFLGDRAVLITPRDADWLTKNQCFVASRVDFEQLSGGKHWRQYSSTWQLVSGLRNPSLDYGAGVRVEVHSRIVRPFLDMTLLFLGLPLVLTRNNRKVFVAVGFCILIVVAFSIVILTCHYLGSNMTLSPALAAWLPVAIFVPLAVALCEPLRE